MPLHPFGGRRPVNIGERAYNPAFKGVPKTSLPYLRLSIGRINKGLKTGTGDYLNHGSHGLLQIAETCEKAAKHEEAKGNDAEAAKYQEKAIALRKEAADFLMQAGRTKRAVSALKKAGIENPEEFLRQEGWNI